MPLTFAEIQNLPKGTPVVVTTVSKSGRTRQDKGVLWYCFEGRFSIANAISNGVHSAWDLSSDMEKTRMFEEDEKSPFQRKWIIDLDANPLPREAYSYHESRE